MASANKFKDQSGNSREVEWLDIQKFLMNRKKPDLENVHLVVGGMPAPRTGPHDHLVVKVSKSGLLNKADGDILELNTYDVTMRGQRDFDTDKLPFYMDTPFSALKESMASNALLKEALPVEMTPSDLSIYNYDSWNTHLDNINKFKKLRGTTIKVHRKLTYLKRVFEDIGGFDIEIDGVKYGINFKEGLGLHSAQQKLTSDSQAVLDIYNKLAKTFIDGQGEVNGRAWESKTMFTGKDSFFTAKLADGTPAKVPKAIQRVIQKMSDDFGRLLTIESGIWEAGEAKAPRYKDMVRMYSQFKETYGNAKRLNWETYHFLSKQDKGLALDLFFNGDVKRLKDGDIYNVMGGISESIADNPTNFLKSLDGIAKRDYMKEGLAVQPAKTNTPDGGSLTQYFNKVLGQSRQEVLDLLIYAGERPDDIPGAVRDVVFRKIEGSNKDVTFSDEAWNAFKEGKNYEKMLAEANHIQNGIIRAEKLIAKEKKNFKPDENYIAHQIENVQIQTATLNEVMNRLNLNELKKGENHLGQTIKEANSYPNGIVNPPKFGSLKVVDAVRGNTIKELRSDDSPYKLGKNQVVIENPIVLRAGTTHEIIDALATVHTVNGVKAHIVDSDVSSFVKIVKDVKKAMREDLSSMFKNDAYRDWDSYQLNVRRQIDKGMKRIIELAKEGTEGQDTELVGQFDLPANKETYVMDYMISLLGPDATAKRNEFYFLPQSSMLFSSVNKNNSQIMKSVFRAIDDYQLYADNPQFMKKFFRTHRGFYDAFVGGEGFSSGVKRLMNDTFEGAILHHTLDKAMNQPWRPHREYTRLGEELVALNQVENSYAEYFRLIIEDGALVDPYTAARIREKIVNDPELGEMAYDNIFKLSRGNVSHDGFSTSKGLYDTKNPGQFIGHMLKDVGETPRKHIHGQVYTSTAHRTISNHTEGIIGRRNSEETLKDTGELCNK